MDGSQMPGGFPEDDYWKDDGYIGVEVELEGTIPGELADSTLQYQRVPDRQHTVSTETTGSASRSWFQFRRPPQPKAKSEPVHTLRKSGSAPLESKKKEDTAAPKELVIAVFGMTGTGKSSFIQKLTGKEVGIGHGLRSHTSHIEEVTFEIGGVKVTLIDTPGFSDTTRSDAEILTLIASWMKDAYEDNTKLTGVIYLHRILDPRMSGPSLKNLRMLRSLCGSENLKHVILATTMWDKVTKDEGEKRERELIEDSTFWGKLKDDGAKIRRFDYTQGGAMVMVNELLQMSPVVLQIQKEVAIEKKTLIQTDAGRSINEEIVKLNKQHKDELAEVKQELDIAKKAIALEQAKITANADSMHKTEHASEEEKKRLEKEAKELKDEQDRLKKLLQKHDSDAKALKAPINRKSWLRRSWKCVKCKARLTKAKDEHIDEAAGTCPRCHCVQRFE